VPEQLRERVIGDPCPRCAPTNHQGGRDGDRFLVCPVCNDRGTLDEKGLTVLDREWRRELWALANKALEWFDVCGAHEGVIPHGGEQVAEELRKSLGRVSDEIHALPPPTPVR
jgi:cytosine/adenosine deaminase-related metal-dependent hydrolase